MQQLAARVPLQPAPAVAGGQNGAHAGAGIDAMSGDPKTPARCILMLRLRAAGNGDDALRAVAGAAAAAWDRTRRVVLQAPEGIALVGAVAPTLALEAARRAAAHPRAGEVAMALHHGPVRVLGEQRVAGEGLASAVGLAAMAGSRTIVSEAFRQALAAEAPRRAGELDAASDVSAQDGEVVYRDDARRARRIGQRRTLFAAAGILLVLGAGWSARAARDAWQAAHRPALIALDIRPSGEVLVDGVPQGTSPPLVQLQLAPGAHTIEVRNGRAKPLLVQVQLQPGEELSVKHVFPPPPPARRPAAKPKTAPTPAPGPFERFKFW